ncbi:MAG: hypothetical protein RR528_05395 [Angelakisella sp.]
MPEVKSYKHCCVIDAAGFYVTLVLVLLQADPDGSAKENIQYYTLGTGESLIDAPAPVSLIKPQWNGASWVEGATPEELAAAEAAKPPAPSTPPPTLEQQRLDDLEAVVASLAFGGAAV